MIWYWYIWKVVAASTTVSLRFGVEQSLEKGRLADSSRSESQYVVAKAIANNAWNVLIWQWIVANVAFRTQNSGSIRRAIGSGHRLNSVGGVAIGSRSGDHDFRFGNGARLRSGGWLARWRRRGRIHVHVFACHDTRRREFNGMLLEQRAKEETPEETANKRGKLTMCFEKVNVQAKSGPAQLPIQLWQYQATSARSRNVQCTRQHWTAADLIQRPPHPLPQNADKRKTMTHWDDLWVGGTSFLIRPLE